MNLSPDPAGWNTRQVGAIDRIRVGIGGWTYVPWRDNFYPKGLVQRRELEYASRHLSCIEVNGTYYGAQKPATYARWRDETPDGFVFSVKAPKRIVQSKALAKTGPQVEDFVFIQFISAAKERNPAAAMALTAILRQG